MWRLNPSFFLLAALFATGLSGIVAEYILATLATYLLGNSVVQWTVVLSLMLFSMGLGSRVTKYFETRLLELFIGLEFLLSVLTASSVMITYSLMSLTEYLPLIIYFFSMLIGFMIGMEIPLVTRINSRYESLKANISGVMEYDYYGSLVGGLLYAFLALPYMGLTYTPFLLGSINFIVALILFFRLRFLVVKKFRWPLTIGGLLAGLMLLGGTFIAEPIVLFGEQSRYADKVVFSEQTPYQRITITEWQGNHWLYLDGHRQLASIDEWQYHEPLVHPAMQLFGQPKEVLILGGGDGCAIREALKYPSVEKILLVDLDPRMTDLGANLPILRNLNQSAYHHPKVSVINQDAFTFLESNPDFFDVIIADFPDPRSVTLSRLYSVEFYRLCNKHLRHRGVLVTQAASPHYTPKAFRCIQKTMSGAGFNALPMHHYIPSFGRWGWILGEKDSPNTSLKGRLQHLSYEERHTRFLNQEAMYHITSFGKDLVPLEDVEENSIHDPVVYRYYLDGL